MVVPAYTGMEWSEVGGGGNNSNNTASNNDAASSSHAPTIKNHSVTYFNEHLYCFGGYDGRRNHNSLLLYSIQDRRWIRPHHEASETVSGMLPPLGVGAAPLNNNNNNNGVPPPMMPPGDVNNNNNNNNFVNGANNGAGVVVPPPPMIPQFPHFHPNHNHNQHQHHGSLVADTSIVVKGTPPPGRNGHSATLAAEDEENGRIIIIGGWLGMGPLAASE